MKIKIFTYLVTILVVVQLSVVLGSWILNSVLLDSGVRSLISGEGIRWLSSNYVSFTASPALVWLVLFGAAYGSLKESGLTSIFFMRVKIQKIERTALLQVMLFLILYVAVTFLLLMPPHAILLSATGMLLPSPFMMALVPITTTCLFVASVIFGFSTHHFKDLKDVCLSVINGLRAIAPLILVYILCVLLYNSVCYVFGFY